MLAYGAGETIFLANPDGSLGESVALSGVRVPSYTTWDWQTVYNFNKDIRGTIGILNLFDRDPPRSLQTGRRRKPDRLRRAVRQSDRPRDLRANRRQVLTRARAGLGSAVHPSPKACWIAAR